MDVSSHDDGEDLLHHNDALYSREDILYHSDAFYSGGVFLDRMVETFFETEEKR